MNKIENYIFVFCRTIVFCFVIFSISIWNFLLFCLSFCFVLFLLLSSTRYFKSILLSDNVNPSTPLPYPLLPCRIFGEFSSSPSITTPRPTGIQPKKKVRRIKPVRRVRQPWPIGQW